MSEEVASIKKRWDSRILRGVRKGQFKKKISTKKREKWQQQKRLCQDVRKEVVSSTNELLEEREIIYTGFFSKQMWCDNCKIPLSLDWAVQKIQKGLGYVYDVKCCKCSKLKTIFTDTPFGKKSEYFTVNAKAVMGIIDSGFGETQMNLWLSSMNIATVSNTLIKRYERMVGKEVEAVASESCSKALQEEKSLTQSKDDIIEDE